MLCAHPLQSLWHLWDSAHYRGARANDSSLTSYRLSSQSQFPTCVSGVTTFSPSEVLTHFPFPHLTSDQTCWNHKGVVSFSKREPTDHLIYQKWQELSQSGWLLIFRIQGASFKIYMHKQIWTWILWILSYVKSEEQVMIYIGRNWYESVLMRTPSDEHVYRLFGTLYTSNSINSTLWKCNLKCFNNFAEINYI